MSGDAIELVDRVSLTSLWGGVPKRGDLLGLLELDPDGEGAAYLGRRAREMARVVAGNRGRIWAAIGIDYRPCSMNCQFCSFGEAWSLIEEPRVLTDREVIKAAENFSSKGASWIVLRTTQSFEVDRLYRLATAIRRGVPGPYELVVNTGEFDQTIAKHMFDAGINMIYHTIRLGEGKTTPFDPAVRARTLDAVRASPLKLAYLIEPVGIEHSNEEILDSYDACTSYSSTLSGAMARVNVKGTPFGDMKPVSESRMAQIIAVTRLAGGHRTPNICVHPPSMKALEWGANVLVVEEGAVPRERTRCQSSWREFNIAEAKIMFLEAGYEIGP